MYTSGGVTKLLLPASTYSGVPATYWRLGQGDELGGGSLPDFSLVFFNASDYLSGTLTVDGAGLGVGMYPVVIIMSNMGRF